MGKHFVLVHGSCHGAWCWYKITTLLKSAGQRVTTLDLGGCGVDPSRPDQINSLSEYVKPLMEFMANLPQDEKVILVGHSYGGFCISLATEKFPTMVAVAVFVTAFVPNCLTPPAELILEFFRRAAQKSLSFLDSMFTFDDGPDNLPISAMFGPNFMASNIYQLCPSEDLELAKVLVKPTGLFVKDLAKESLLTEENFGTVDRVFIFSESDKLIDKDLQEWFMTNNPPKEVIVMEGADHMVMLSKPQELFLYLQEIAERY